MTGTRRIIVYVAAFGILGGGALWLWATYGDRGETMLGRAYRLCEPCGLRGTDVDLRIGQIARAGITRDKSLELYRQTFGGEYQAGAEACLPCTTAILDVVEFGSQESVKTGLAAWFAGVNWKADTAVAAMIAALAAILTTLINSIGKGKGQGTGTNTQTQTQTQSNVTNVGLNEERTAQLVDTKMHERLSPYCEDVKRLGIYVSALAEKLPVPDTEDALKRKAVELYNEGIECAERKDHVSAIAKLHAAIELGMQGANAHVEVGVSEGVLDDPMRAERAFRRAIEIDPKEPRAYYNLGIALRLNGDVDGAIAAYRRAIELDPKIGVVYTLLGVALCDEGDVDGAIAALSKAIELNPKNGFSYHYLGDALRDKGDFDRAIATYRELLELYPKSARAHYDLAQAQAGGGQVDDALESLTTAIELFDRYRNRACEDFWFILDDPRMQKLVGGEEE